MYPDRKIMLERHLKDRGITDPRILDAMASVDRRAFVPEKLQDQAYEDSPLPIGGGQTISQPYIVAYMAQELGVGPEDTVLEVGAGCGYNAAILSRIAKQVYSVEIVADLVEVARKNLETAEIGNVEVRHADGHAGWPEHAPFEKIILTAAPPTLPAPLKQQLAIGGRLLAPIGFDVQDLILLEKLGAGEYHERTLLPVRFVPMTRNN